MRPLATWLVVGGLAVLGLFAARDALRSDAAPASSPTSSLVEKPHPTESSGAPSIPERHRLAGELGALGARGVLYLTDASCRRYLLRLPSLVWTTSQSVLAPDCGRVAPLVVNERVGLSAEQVGAETIEVGAESWRLRFRGTDPAFTPDGVLTYLREGRLYAWLVRCPTGISTTLFGGNRPLPRCPRLVPGSPKNLQEVVWLNGEDFAAVAGPELTPRLLVVRHGRTTRLFLSVGSRMGGLQASPGGRWLAARVEGDLVLFDTRRVGALRLPSFGPEAGAITWSPDDRLGAVATRAFVNVFPSSTPENGIAIPVAAVDVTWR